MENQRREKIRLRTWRRRRREERDGEREQTKQCWCLFSLWLVMGDCSQHKHMPSWLTHFLLHSTSQHWATQAQDTTARVCMCVCVCLHACIPYACSLLLWFTWTHTICTSPSVTKQALTSMHIYVDAYTARYTQIIHTQLKKTKNKHKT